MNLTEKDLRKIEVNAILRESHKAKKEKNLEKLDELRNSLSLVVSESALRGFDTIFGL